MKRTEIILIHEILRTDVNSLQVIKSAKQVSNRYINLAHCKGLANADAVTLGEGNEELIHMVSSLGIQPSVWVEFLRIRKDGGVSVHKPGGHANDTLYQR